MTIASGARLGRYEIQAALGSGGMGEVYRAKDTQLGRTVAIKVVSEHTRSDLKMSKRLLQEARAASGLNHPNICTIYEVGEAEDISYIAMEYVAGRTLSADLLGHHGLDARIVIRYGIQMADALAHAHEHGIIHRDLKCDNILVSVDGRIKILDFGLAEHFTAGDIEKATVSNSTISQLPFAGTLAYMAPEILHGRTADLRSDIWALGIVLYALALGVQPFQGETPFEITSAILNDAPALLCEISTGLRMVIERCLQKESAQRYQRAGEVRAALEAIQFKTDIGKTGKRSSKAIDSLAVLPFFNVGGDAETEYLCDGLTETIINNLSQMPKLRVVPRSTVFRYKNHEIDLQSVGEELNVSAVLGGRVLQRSGDLVISTELVDVVRRSQLWGQQYNRKIAEILAIQDEISEEISQKLRLQLTRADRDKLTKRQTLSTEAYQLYLKGRYFLNRRSAMAFEVGIQAFQQAIATDPRYALAYAGLADAHMLAAWWESVPPAAAVQRARDAAQKALNIDSQLAEPHTSLGLAKFAHDWEWDGGVREMRRAIELNPRDTQAYHWSGLALCALGRTAEGNQYALRAYELEPLNLMTGVFHAVIPDYFERRFDQVIRALDGIAEMSPELPVASFFRTLALLSVNRTEDAVVQAQRGAELCGHLPLALGALGLACGFAGNQDGARKIIGQLQARLDYVPPLPVAFSYAGLGEVNQAFQWLERAVEERSLWIPWLAVDPRFDTFRGNARYYSILEQMALPRRVSAARKEI